jgi:OOP family OmpA-OmpF porin
MHYADFGEASLSGNNGDTFALNGTTYTFTANDVNIAVGATSLGAAATVGHDFTNKLRAFAKLGLHAWELDASVTSSAGSASLTNSGTDLFYGIGAKYALTDRVSIRAEFERFNIDSDEIDFVSAGVSYRF